MDLSRPLSADDIAHLKSLHPLSVVERMVELARNGEEGSSDPSSPSEDHVEPAFEGEPVGLPEEAASDAGEPEEDLIGEVPVEDDFDPFTHTTVEVRERMKQAGRQECERLREMELSRSDREPRSSITEYFPHK